MIDREDLYFIGETAFHHEGDKSFAIELVHEAKKLKLDAIKFHLLLDLDDYMVAQHSVIETLRPWCLSAKDWDVILAEVSGMDIILLCNDVASVDYALNCKYPVKAIELHASGLNDVFLLERVSKFDNTIMLGTGGSPLNEIDFAISYLRSRGKTDILLMHGFQNYPTKYEDVKLARMNKLSTLFGLPIGYADHTDPNDPNMELISTLGIAAGYNILEKHFTHRFGEKRIDSQSAVSTDQFKRIIELGKMIYSVFGVKDSLGMTEAELKYGNTGPMKKAIVARKDIAAGEEISLSNVAFKRTDASSSLTQNQLGKLLGNKAVQPISKDSIIDFSNVEFSFKVNDFSQFNNTSK